MLKDVANRVDSELNRSILLGVIHPAQGAANIRQPQGDIFSADDIMHEFYRETLTTGTVGKQVSGIFGLLIAARRSNCRWARSRLQ
jgi:hypothetical protein